MEFGRAQNHPLDRVVLCRGALRAGFSVRRPAPFGLGQALLRLWQSRADAAASVSTRDTCNAQMCNGSSGGIRRLQAGRQLTPVELTPVELRGGWAFINNSTSRKSFLLTRGRLATLSSTPLLDGLELCVHFISLLV